jgi:hypothetical protein
MKIKVKLLSPCRKVNSKWIKGLYVRTETETAREKVRKTLEDIGIANTFLSRTQIAQQIIKKFTSGLTSN